MQSDELDIQKGAAGTSSFTVYREGWGLEAGQVAKILRAPREHSGREKCDGCIELQMGVNASYGEVHASK